MQARSATAHIRRSGIDHRGPVPQPGVVKGSAVVEDVSAADLVHPLRPDGRWYFVGPRSEDPHDSEEGGFKISQSKHYPREQDNTSQLENVEMYTCLWWNPSHSRATEYGYVPEEGIECKVHRWGVRYVAGRGGKDNDAAALIVQWQVGDWRRSQDVTSIFEGLGQQGWLDFEFSDRRDLGEFSMSFDHSLF
ncbi:hypothetical protein NQ176_g7576 [Zarea fungicola]|uniref:Uncharacterized protein n=1 Tax=Zarea fungicola TaxID=93591 RepID=A0ACC1MZM2_9HYPO|nr:hypothetical protein NQ176_g7576 [Lecanicillium fungicola]